MPKFFRIVEETQNKRTISLLNLKHVIRVKYVPGYHDYISAEDSDDSQEHHRDVESTLRIILSEMCSEEHFANCDSHFISASGELFYRGNKADEIFGDLNNVYELQEEF